MSSSDNAIFYQTPLMGGMLLQCLQGGVFGNQNRRNNFLYTKHHVSPRTMKHLQQGGNISMAAFAMTLMVLMSDIQSREHTSPETKVRLFIRLILRLIDLLLLDQAQCYPRSATLFPSACQNGQWSAKAPFASCRVSRGMEELYVACYLMAQ